MARREIRNCSCRHTLGSDPNPTARSFRPPNPRPCSEKLKSSRHPLPAATRHHDSRPRRTLREFGHASSRKRGDRVPRSPTVALPQRSRVAGSVGVFPASETFPARRARTPERAFASDIETKPWFSVTVGFMGSIFTIRELGAVHGDATAAKRYRPHIVARTANVNE